jgi:hypothetical protein
MRPLSPPGVLDLWERGLNLHPLDRGVLALRAGWPEASESVADWPLGRRNRALAALRRACFGELRGRTTCPQCGEPVEFGLDGGTLAEPSDVEIETVSVAGETFRLPTSRILASVVDEPDSGTAAAKLCDRCRTGGAEREQGPLTADDVERIGEAMALADPLAEIAFAFECPSCGAEFHEGLDLAEFFWREIEAEAKRLLEEVHALASAYGWRERDVLALSPVRRAYYLERALG